MSLPNWQLRDCPFLFKRFKYDNRKYPVGIQFLPGLLCRVNLHFVISNYPVLKIKHRSGEPFQYKTFCKFVELILEFIVALRILWPVVQEALHFVLHLPFNTRNPVETERPEFIDKMLYRNFWKTRKKGKSLIPDASCSTVSNICGYTLYALKIQMWHWNVTWVNTLYVQWSQIL